MDPGSAFQSPDNRSSDLFATGVVMAILAIVAVILRAGCKRHLKLPVSADDYMIFLSLVSPNPATLVSNMLSLTLLSCELLALGLCAMLILCQSTRHNSSYKTLTLSVRCTFRLRQTHIKRKLGRRQYLPEGMSCYELKVAFTDLFKRSNGPSNSSTR